MNVRYSRVYWNEKVMLQQVYSFFELYMLLQWMLKLIKVDPPYPAQLISTFNCTKESIKMLLCQQCSPYSYEFLNRCQTQHTHTHTCNTTMYLMIHKSPKFIGRKNCNWKRPNSVYILMWCPILKLLVHSMQYIIEQQYILVYTAKRIIESNINQQEASFL